MTDDDGYDAAANSLGCWELAVAEMRKKHMAYRDENDAGYATRGTDPANGLKYIIDFRTRARVYQLAQCTGCGMTPWSSVPSAETECVRCKVGLTAKEMAR